MNHFLRGLIRPVVLMLIAGLGSVILVPWITGLATESKVRQETRLKTAVEIVENNTKTISQLNQIITRLGMFDKDNKRLQPSPRELKQRQDKVAEDANALYLEFNKTGWWWYKDLRDEALILKIVNQNNSQDLNQHISAYAKNIEDSVKAVENVLHACVASDYEVGSDKVSKLYDEAHNILDDSSHARQQLLRDLINDFTQ